MTHTGALRAALQRLEVACSEQARLLSPDAYNQALLADGMQEALYELDKARRDARVLLLASPTAGEPGEPLATPVQATEGYRLMPATITEDMHVAAVKVLQRASGLDGLPQRMLDAMRAAAPAV